MTPSLSPPAQVFLILHSSKHFVSTLHHQPYWYYWACLSLTYRLPILCFNQIHENITFNTGNEELINRIFILHLGTLLTLSCTNPISTMLPGSYVAIYGTYCSLLKSTIFGFRAENDVNLFILHSNIHKMQRNLSNKVLNRHPFCEMTVGDRAKF